MLMLGIESSCDECSIALIRDAKEIIANLVASQVDLHGKYGGVVPEIACRRHLEVLNPLLAEALEKAGIGFGKIEAVSVANRPGLVGAVLIGVAAAKVLAGQKFQLHCQECELDDHYEEAKNRELMASGVASIQELAKTIGSDPLDEIIKAGKGQDLLKLLEQLPKDEPAPKTIQAVLA